MNARAYAAQGAAHLGSRQFEAAYAAYAEALRLEPGNAYYRFWCGECLFHLGQFAEVIAMLGDVNADADPALSVELAITLGRAQQLLGQSVAAEMNLFKAFMTDPGNENAAYNLAVFYEQENLPQQAIAFLEEAIQKHPTSVRLNYNLASNLAQCGRSALAVRALETTLQLSPQHIHAHHNLAMVQLRLGALQEGWAHYAWRSNRHVAEGSPAQWLPHTAALPQDLGGTTVLLEGEQGIGDELFFMRYLPVLKQRGARIHYRSHNLKLAPLLQQLERQQLQIGRASCRERV